MITTTGKSIIAAALAGAAVLSFVHWRLQVRPETKVTSGVIVADMSESIADEPAAIVGLAERALGQARLARGATLTILATGDGQTSNEPRLVAKYEVPFSRRALEGRGAIAKRKREILSDLRGRVEKVSRTNRSPILLAVRRAVEDLRGGGCAADDECYMFVRTDGVELSDKALRTSIQRLGKTRSISQPISNEGIRIVFCGLAEINADAKTGQGERPAPHSARWSEHLPEAWRTVFSVPALITFEPYCPRNSIAIAED